mmetsp:Transcript_66813/g.145729  ORF Transcript_66813/g.145729 Transcript_66813/m.145729 type:complete len:270 (-) Transcript_66813:16-825(-)
MWRAGSLRLSRRHFALSASRRPPVPLQLGQATVPRWHSGTAEEGKGKGQQGQKPQGRALAATAFAADGVSFFDMITLPTRHFVWTVALNALSLWRPELWSRRTFYDGIEQGVRTVHSQLAEGDLHPLFGLVDDPLMSRFREEKQAVAAERWADPPVLRQAGVVSLLWANTGNNRQGVLSLKVELAVYLREDYKYLPMEGSAARSADESGSSSSGQSTDSSKPKLLYSLRVNRLQRWVFERPVETGGHWKLVSLAAEPWHWKRRDPVHGQ